jgi:hypothetical protein
MPSIGVLEHYQKPTDRPLKRVKRSAGQTIVQRGVAVWIIKNVLLQMRMIVPRVPVEQPSGRQPAPPKLDPAEPCQSVHMGKLRWEPPENKRPLKAHPWRDITV